MDAWSPCRGDPGPSRGAIVRSGQHPRLRPALAAPGPERERRPFPLSSVRLSVQRRPSEALTARLDDRCDDGHCQSWREFAGTTDRKKGRFSPNAFNDGGLRDKPLFSELGVIDETTPAELSLALKRATHREGFAVVQEDGVMVLPRRHLPARQGIVTGVIVAERNLQLDRTRLPGNGTSPRRWIAMGAGVPVFAIGISRPVDRNSAPRHPTHRSAGAADCRDRHAGHPSCDDWRRGVLERHVRCQIRGHRCYEHDCPLTSECAGALSCRCRHRECDDGELAVEGRERPCGRDRSSRFVQGLRLNRPSAPRARHPRQSCGLSGARTRSAKPEKPVLGHRPSDGRP